jgi:predicted AAA+ superfamily ATPase
MELVVTGSGRLDVYQKGGDSLLGRYALHRLHPFTVGESLASGRQSIATPESLDHVLADPPELEGAHEALEQVERFTGFPEPLFAGRADRLRRWRRNRRQLVLREDLRDLSRIRDLGLVDRMVELLPERIGAPLSINALSEDLGVAFRTAQTWLETLGRLYYVFEIRPFAGKLARTLRREGKVYLYDHSEIDDPGARFENVVALHLLKLVDAWNDLGHGDFALHYVRDKERREVDFVVTERRRPWLMLEAKLSDGEPSPALEYFRARLKPKHAVQLVRHGAMRRRGEIIVVPAERILALL